MAIYCFDGSSGCEKCGAATGCFPYEISKPHPNCKCSISRILEECTKVDESYTEVPGPKYEIENGPGLSLNSVLVEVYQEIWCIFYQKWICIDFTTAQRYPREIIDEWVDVRLVSKFERILC